MVQAVLHEPPKVAKLNDRWCWQFYMNLLHCIHVEDPQRMNIGSWYEDKAYSTLEKVGYYFP